jgi:hypothetical protein
MTTTFITSLFQLLWPGFFQSDIKPSFRLSLRQLFAILSARPDTNSELLVSSLCKQAKAIEFRLV